MKLKYWGSRGSLSVPSSDKIKVGANTLCVEVRSKHNDLLILDAGFGIIELGNKIMREVDLNQPHTYHILLSHFHWDHIQGLQFFKPIYFPQSTLIFYNPQSITIMKKVMEHLFQGCYCPFESVYNLPAKILFKKLSMKSTTIQHMKVTPCIVDHPVATYAYKIEEGKKSIVYATDHESADEKINRPFIKFAHQSDILIHDSQYQITEYENRVGWGHSTAEKAVDNGIQAKTKQLHLFHHDIIRSDIELENKLTELQTKHQQSDFQIRLAKELEEYEV